MRDVLDPIGESPPAGPQWPVISALGVMMIFTWGSTYYLPAVLSEAIGADTGWPGWAITGALSAGLLLGGLVSPRVGLAIQRHGGQRVLALGTILIAIGLSILALSPTLWVFWIGWLVLGLGMAAGLYDPAFATLGQLYGRDARTAITQLTLWGGFASTVCWPLSAWMLDLWGWRGVATAYALVNIAFLLPLVLVAIPRPADLRAKQNDKQSIDISLTARERRVTLLLGILFVLHGLAIVTIAVWLFTFLGAQGVTLQDAVLLGALIGPAQVAARLLEMAAGGRYHPIWTLAISTVLTAGGMIFLALDFGLPAAAMILVGGGNGLYSIARGALPLAVFGPERYAPIVGRLARPWLLSQAGAPALSGGAIALIGPPATLYSLALITVVNLGVLCLLIRTVIPQKTSPHPGG